MDVLLATSDELLGIFAELLGTLEEPLGPFVELLGPLDVVLPIFDELLDPIELPGPLRVLLGPFDPPYPVEVDTLSEADTKVPGRLVLGSSEDPDDTELCDVGTEAEGPEATGEDIEPLLLDMVPELDLDEPTAADEPELSAVELDGDALPEDEPEIRLLSTLDCELGSRLEPPVTDAEKDRLVPGLVLRLKLMVGRLTEPEPEPDPEADPEAETGDVPLVAGGRGPLLTETVGIVPVAELPVLLAGGCEEPDAVLELRPVAGGAEPVAEMEEGGAVSGVDDDGDGGLDDCDGGMLDIEEEDAPDETPGVWDEDSPTDEDGGDPEGEDDCPDEVELPGGPPEDEGPLEDAGP